MDLFAPPSNLLDLRPGTVLRLNRGFYDHVALLGEHALTGERRVLSFGPGPSGLAELPFSQFAGDKAVAIDGYLGSLPPQEVLSRARQIASQRRYSWLGFNCEHFVRAAHGAAVDSPQLGRAFMLAAGALILSAAR